jgi:hypothetical protein
MGSSSSAFRSVSTLQGIAYDTVTNYYDTNDRVISPLLLSQLNPIVNQRMEKASLDTISLVGIPNSVSTNQFNSYVKGIGQDVIDSYSLVPSNTSSMNSTETSLANSALAKEQNAFLVGYILIGIILLFVLILISVF